MRFPIALTGHRLRWRALIQIKSHDDGIGRGSRASVGSKTYQRPTKAAQVGQGGRLRVRPMRLVAITRRKFITLINIDT